jgi:putative transcriptional regulator
VPESSPTPDSPISLHGQLLLAAPSLRDGIFDRSVILLAEHSADQGAFGLIMNQPTGHTVGDFLKEKQFAPLLKIAVHQGGPVAREHLTFSAFWWQEAQLRWALRISADDAIQHAHRPGTLVRAFIGYSGWTAGQLEGELRRHSWIATRPATSFLGLSHDRNLWAEILRNMSPFHRILAASPDQPNLN